MDPPAARNQPTQRGQCANAPVAFLRLLMAHAIKPPGLVAISFYFANVSLTTGVSSFSISFTVY